MLTNNCCDSTWKNLYLIRHGESTCNEVNRFAGAIDAPLTSLGEAQAHKAAKQWQGAPPDIIFTSPLARARRTAHIVFPDKVSPQPYTYNIDPRISERHFGDFTLQNKTLLQRRIGLKDYESALYSDSPAMQDGESFATFYGRIKSFFDEELLPLLRAGKKVLVVAHKYVIELLSRMILGLAVDDGYDLRLPNAKIICGDQLAGYVSKESRTLNLIQDWVILHHSLVLFAAVIAGIFLRHLDILPETPSWVTLLILSSATGISLARIDLSSLKQFIFAKQSVRPLLQRYIFLPMLVCCLSLLDRGNNLYLFFALLLAAPSAITGITVSRSMGGLVAPAVRIIIITTFLSIICTLPLLIAKGIPSIWQPALWLILISAVGLATPMLLVAYLRKRHPIETANFAERNGATSILLLCLFIILSFSGINIETAWPSLPLVFIFAIFIRFFSLLLANNKSLFCLDDYISMSYPNIFFVVLLTSLLGLNDLATLATWYLVPMFALAPVDEWVCKKKLSSLKLGGLINFLRIEDPIYHTDTPQVPSFSSVFPPLSRARRSLSMSAKPALVSSGSHRLL